MHKMATHTHTQTHIKRISMLALWRTLTAHDDDNENDGGDADHHPQCKQRSYMILRMTVNSTPRWFGLSARHTVRFCTTQIWRSQIRGNKQNKKKKTEERIEESPEHCNVDIKHNVRVLHVLTLHTPTCRRYICSEIVRDICEQHIHHCVCALRLIKYILYMSLSGAGLYGVGWLAAWLVDGNWEPNKTTTKKRRKSNKNI